LTLIIWTIGKFGAIVVTSVTFCFCFFHLLANLINLFKYSSYHGMANMVSIGVRDIFTFMKWVNIFDLTIIIFSNQIPTFFHRVILSFGGYEFFIALTNVLTCNQHP
jgi:hypothetical protein